MRISYWSSDVCSSALHAGLSPGAGGIAPCLQPPAGDRPGGLLLAAVDRGLRPRPGHLGEAAGGQPQAPARVDDCAGGRALPDAALVPLRRPGRSEEHTSELQSLMRISYAVFCLKKKNYNNHSLFTMHP